MATIPTFQPAFDILGNDFIRPLEVAEAYDAPYTATQLEELAWTLPEEKVLRWARDNGFAVLPGPPNEMNFLDIHELSTDFFYRKNDPWFTDNRQTFARSDTVGATWLVVHKDPAPNSINKTWDEQQALLNGNERVPNAAEATWFLTTYAKVRGIRLVPNVYVRTSSVHLVGCRFNVGFFDGWNLLVRHLWDDLRDDFIGVASARTRK